MTNQVPAVQSSKIPTYLPVAEAARQYGMSRRVLTQMIQTGKIDAVQLPSGELLVPAERNGAEPKSKEEFITEKYFSLRDQPISASEASRKYSKIHGIPISQPLLSRWAKLRYITVLERGYRLKLDEADVAYCTEIFARKYKQYDGRMQGVNVFDENGNPYQLKDPDVAAQKRVMRRSARQEDDAEEPTEELVG